ncbi:hypothetical protein HRbin07_00386 [bacterium HR07]|nr:hypothetical protein HRbin07_00386 [bacterium HR07]
MIADGHPTLFEFLNDIGALLGIEISHRPGEVEIALHPVFFKNRDEFQQCLGALGDVPKVVHVNSKRDVPCRGSLIRRWGYAGAPPRVNSRISLLPREKFISHLGKRRPADLPRFDERVYDAAEKIFDDAKRPSGIAAEFPRMDREVKDVDSIRASDF